MTVKLAILISGRGSNMVAIADAIDHGCLRGLCEIAIVIADKQIAQGITIAQQRGFKTCVIPSKDKTREEFEQQLIAACEAVHADWIILAGFMRILSPLFVTHYKDRILNIHPADTRRHQGRDGYQWAFENRLDESAITVHLVDAGLDTGRIIQQQPFSLRGCETLEEVEERGLAVEHQLYAQAIREVVQAQ